MAKVLSGAGLRGQVAGKTALSTVGVSGSGLTYRGYDVKDLANNCQFEEVAYLVWNGNLPNSLELSKFMSEERQNRRISINLTKIIEHIPKKSHPKNIF